jgi:hypothetical protein
MFFSLVDSSIKHGSLRPILSNEKKQTTEIHTSWINLQKIMQSRKSSQKVTYYMAPLVSILKVRALWCREMGVALKAHRGLCAEGNTLCLAR